MITRHQQLPPGRALRLRISLATRGVCDGRRRHRRAVCPGASDALASMHRCCSGLRPG